MRAGQLEAQRGTRALFAEATAGRGDLTAFERQVLAATALTALAVAIDEWVAVDGRSARPELIDTAFAALGVDQS
ncbi:hypothetical protein [Actinoplanes sp. NPDC049265]|uniref:hypothetical protein n=1 Tax=Actinoplanes sp. NPDC049265 TaxID=3363902 RepID=UPI00371AE22B